MTTYAITGANRGIGLAMTQLLADRAENVLAICRDPDSAETLTKLAEQVACVTVLSADVTDEASLAAAVSRASEHVSAVDVLINNAGMLVRNESIDQFDSQVMRDTFEVNVIGVMNTISHFLPLLRNGDNPRIVNISSQLGSLLAQGNRRSGIYSYNASKAALNMVTRMLAHDLVGDGIAVVSMHPGWVQTDMGGPSAAISATVSAEGILNQTDQLTLANSNQFFVYDGSHHPW